MLLSNQGLPKGQKKSCPFYDILKQVIRIKTGAHKKCAG